jgi:hypothetical protein
MLIQGGYVHSLHALMEKISVRERALLVAFCDRRATIRDTDVPLKTQGRTVDHVLAHRPSSVLARGTSR